MHSFPWPLNATGMSVKVVKEGMTFSITIASPDRDADAAVDRDAAVIRDADVAVAQEHGRGTATVNCFDRLLDEVAR